MRRKLLFLAALICLDVALPLWAAANNQIIEEYYSRGIYPQLARLLRTLFGWIPFSLAEVILVGSLFVTLWVLWRLGREMVSLVSPDDVPGWLFSCLRRGLTILISIHLAFVLFWGLNYYRLPLADQLGLWLHSAEKEELLALAKELAVLTGEERARLVEDDEGVAILGADQRSYLTLSWLSSPVSISPEAFSAEVTPLQIRAKPVFFSNLMSYTYITGFFFPFTGEANVNMNVPLFELPSTIAHEMAHQLGIAREDEANFISWCHSRSEGVSPEVRYSGSLRALVYVLNAAYDVADRDEYAEIWDCISSGVERDLAASREFWNRYSGQVQAVSEQVNDAYLKSNQQVDGVQSYGRMVDLLLAERSRRLDAHEPPSP